MHLALLPALFLAQIVGGRLETVARFDGSDAGGELGWAVAGAGDVDADGCADLILGAPFLGPGGRTSAGSAFVYSGATGLPLWRFDGPLSGDQLGKSVAGAGDVDGDGHDDLVAGAPQADPNGHYVAGSVFVYSGRDGRLLWRFDGSAAGNMLGWSVSGAGDVNGDGFADVIAGAPEADPSGLQRAGVASVYSGADGTLLWRFSGSAWLDELGRSVAGAGDADGDGCGDVLVGAPGMDPGGRSGAGSALLYSGAAGALLWRFDGGADGDDLGRSVAAAGDVDRDGRGDVVAGAPGADPAGRGDAGSALVYSSAGGTLLWSFDGGAPGDRLGFSVSGAGDVDGDGADDVIAGAHAAAPGGAISAGSACVYSGATGALLWRFDGGAPGDLLGWSVAGAGDADGDGFDDVVVGAPRADPGARANAGAAAVMGLDPFLTANTREISAALGGRVECQLDFPDEAASARYRVLASWGTGPIAAGRVLIPLARDRLLLRSLLGRYPPFVSAAGTHGVLDASGRATAVLDFAGGLPAMGAGTTLHLAAVAFFSGAPRHSSVAAPLTLIP